MKKIGVILLLLTTLIAMRSYVERNVNLEIIDVLENEVYITSDGTVLEEIQNYISDYLEYDKNLITVKEITVEDIWKNNGIQIFRIETIDDMNDIIVLYSNGKVDEIFRGQNIQNVLLSDLDNDRKYEICVEFSSGFGYVISNIVVYSFSEERTYNYELGNDESLDINYEKNEIDVLGIDYSKETTIRNNDDGIQIIEMPYKYIGTIKIIDKKISIIKS